MAELGSWFAVRSSRCALMATSSLLEDASVPGGMDPMVACTVGIIWSLDDLAWRECCRGDTGCGLDLLAAEMRV